MILRQYLDLDGLRLSYLERGSPSPASPSVVLLHGLMGCADTMLPLMEALPASVHLIALDFAGAGRSDRRPNLDARLATTANTTQRFIAALNLHRPILLGHSHGGSVALHIAATAPAAVHSLVLLAPAHPYFVEANPLIRFYLTLPGRLFAYSIPWYPQWMLMIGLRRMAGPRSVDTPERLRPYRENLRTPGTMRHLLHLLSTWHQDFAELRKLLTQPLATPTLLLWGDSDRAVPPASIVEFRRHLKHSQLGILRGIGHRPAEEHPEAVAEHLTNWLTQTAISPNSSETQALIAPLITSSLAEGEPSIPAKKWSAPSTQTIRLGS